MTLEHDKIIHGLGMALMVLTLTMLGVELTVAALVIVTVNFVI